MLPIAISGCVSVSGVADGLSAAMLNQPDIETVRTGLPAYLIFVDAMIQDDPEDEELLAAGARLYSAYGGSFVDDEARAKQMASKAFDYAKRSLCIALKDVCMSLSRPLAEYQQVLAEVDDDDANLKILFTFATAWVGWVQAHSDDWQAIADLPKVQAAFEQVLKVNEAYDNGTAHLCMGVLLTLRPAALGGKPEQGQTHFLRAIELTSGRNLMAKVLYARHYARLVFDQQLHDSLLNEVLSASVEAPGLTLINVLAQQQAQALLASSKDYF